MDPVLADRLQFAFTIMFHYLFPVGTIGLAPFVAAYTWKAARNSDEESARIARFWTRIFAINFAAGVVTGIPMEFQFGTNWAAFSRRSGAVVGQPLAMESVFAFFLESVFLGVLLYRRSGLPTMFTAWSAVLVCTGSWLSGFFIVATNSWMQHPVGYSVAPDGTIRLESIWAMLLSPFLRWQFAHVLDAALLAGGFIVAGIGAYYLLARRDEAIGQRFVRAGTIVGLIFALLAVFPTGDRNGSDVTTYQPVKLAAMEGLFASTHGAPLAIIGMPDVATHRLVDPVFVPEFLSFLAYGNFNASVNGLDAYARELWPPVELTYYAYHVMVGLGTIFVAVMTLAVALLVLARLWRARWMLWVLMLVMPFPYIANEAGWVVTEVGRQPWIIYGLMQTANASSPTVAAGETVFTLIGFVGMYFLLGVLFLYLVLREIGIGPSSSVTLSSVEG
ncbi:MAG TPA: cytochrome ubiquinol oxidase subunit I [Candidatus Cybelea sp.]|jgi:cytochrome d ubiquinol oxidase subunit I|nr:cytochrome ubiquinol oxidase subunit I [Candidatus Cybelea sp.]